MNRCSRLSPRLSRSCFSSQLLPPLLDGAMKLLQRVLYAALPSICTSVVPSFNIYNASPQRQIAYPLLPLHRFFFAIFFIRFAVFFVHRSLEPLRFIFLLSSIRSSAMPSAAALALLLLLILHCVPAAAPACFLGSPLSSQAPVPQPRIVLIAADCLPAFSSGRPHQRPQPHTA